MNRSHPPIYTPVEQYHTAPRPHYEANKTEKGGPGWDLLSLAGLILPLGLAIFLFHTTLEDVRGTGVEIVEWVSENRSVIAIFVQIVSGILGLITVKAIVTLINLRTRLSLVKKPMNLDRLAFWASICLQRPDWQISKTSFAATAAFVAACSSIAALWAGAITPVLTSDAPFNVSIQVPAYDDLTVLAGGGDGFDTVTEPMGLFTFHPGFRIPGVIVAAARDATSRSGYANSHDKLDKTGYTYSTRSFGAGATVGLADELLDQGGQSVNSTAVSYKYREKGPVVNVSCGRNESHEVLFYEMSDRPESWTLHVYNMEAYMPDGTARLAAATSLGPDEAFVLAVGGLVDARSFFTLVPDEKAGNSRYARAKDVQCTLDFSETTFDVSVDVLNRTITVVDGDDHQPLDDHRILVEFGIRKLSEVSSALMTSVWTNLMGDAFINNIANVDAFEGNRERATLRGVEMAIESMVDSVLESLSAAQFKILNDRQKVDANVLYKGVRVGDRAFIYAVLVISVLVVLATMVELCATRVWRGTPAFDFTRIVHVAVAASAGGTSLADSKMSGHDDDACRVSLVIPDPRSTVGRLEDVWQ